MRIAFTFLSCVFVIGSCTLFPLEEELLDSVQIDGIDYRAYYVASGATTPIVVHIRRVLDGEEKTIGVYQDYNDAQLEYTGRELMVILKFDTSIEHFKIRTDSVYIELK